MYLVMFSENVESKNQIAVKMALLAFLCLLLFLVSLDIDYVLFILDLYMKYTVEVVPLCTYILWSVIV